MKAIIHFFVVLLVGLGAQAQSTFGIYGNRNARLAENKLIGRSVLECIYSYKVYDPVLDEDREYFKILELGRNHSKFSSYGAYRVDSIIDKDYPKGLTVNEYGRLSAANNPTMESIIKDLRQNTLRAYDKVYMDYYVCEEPIPEIEWTLESASAIICGYECHKATASFRGRKWTAWYCDLPQSNGPWKFGNLPGLILKIEDEDKEHVFEAISIRNGGREFGLKVFNYQKTTRQKFNKALSDYKTNTESYISSVHSADNAKNRDGFSPTNRLFFNPIEKD